MKKFETIDYLHVGTPKQREAFRVLSHYKIMELLQGYNPILAGTFPLDIVVPGSDLDILCYCQDLKEFKQHITTCFSKLQHSTLREVTLNNQQTIIANFFVDGLEIEVFGQNIPVKEQFGYRHMIIEHQILEQKGNDFKRQIIALKQSGLKTEPAFAHLLNLKGNPYTALLDFKL